MSSITKTQKIFSIALVLLLGVIGGYIFLYRAIKEYVVEFANIRVIAVAKNERIEEENRISTIVQNTQEERKELREHLLSTDDPNAFLSLIERLGDDARVTLDVESIVEIAVPNAPQTKGGLSNAVRVDLKASGGFNQVYHLIGLLERMPYVVTFERVSFMWSLQTGLWDGKMSLIVYAYTPDATI